MNAGVGDGDAGERQSGDIVVYCGDAVEAERGWVRKRRRRIPKKKGAKIQNVYLE